MSEKTTAAGKAGTAAAPAVLVQAAQDAMWQPGYPAGGGAS